MAFNGSGLFQINTAGQPVVSGTTISSSVFNALTGDLATGLSTCITKDGQTTVTANIPMSGFKFTGLAIGTSNTDSARVDNANALHTCEFRLTLTSGTPVTTSDVTGAATLYFSPYKGNKIALYDGTNWVMRSSAEVSISNGAMGGSFPHDIFAYDVAGTLTLEAVQWTNDTTRATALALQNGVLVKSGTVTKRYVGTVRTGAAAALEDSYAKRWVWNYYNRVLRPMRATDSTDTWNYTTSTWRQANASTANQLDFVVGWSEDLVSAQVSGLAKNSSANVDMIVGIGLDATNALATGCLTQGTVSQVANQYVGIGASLKTIPAVGRHFLSWIEISGASGTTTWAGDAGSPASAQSGIHGEVLG